MNLKSASIALAKELSSKKFPRENRAAYLSCFLNIGTIDDFLSALESRPTPYALDAANAAPVKADTSPDIIPAGESDSQPR